MTGGVDLRVLAGFFGLRDERSWVIWGLGWSGKWFQCGVRPGVNCRFARWSNGDTRSSASLAHSGGGGLLVVDASLGG